ncbi:hypothetical protein PCH_Pc22g13440 [Penicillium rubens Wisconsin 54-1255]|uniref:Secreted protein n=1 Tax=Penicillium rubens (strain ATCC 28089 / DSM 1075 / NRRL 1951 / Wisconsin 54-1255) TaxID=500485 RepID=B6HT72_PENRW|nr:hypothetical protein PCH_Pc22g13440 [Penicillium rubens Wisconsin 54-1255]
MLDDSPLFFLLLAAQVARLVFIPRTAPRSFFCPRCYAQIFSFLVTCSKVLEIEGYRIGGSDWSDTSKSITSRLLVASDTLVNSFVNVSLYDIETRDSKIII